MFNFYAKNLKAYTAIANEIDNIVASFFSQSQIKSNSATYSVPISTIVNAVTKYSRQLAILFEGIFDFFNEFEQAITNPMGSSK